MVERYKDPVMQEVIRRIIRSAMAEEGITYQDLSQKLNAAGISQTESTLRTKVSTGIMTSSLFIHILSALKVKELNIAVLMEKYRDLQDKSAQDS